MLNFLRELWLAVRRWPVYTGLVALALAFFVSSGLRGHRLLGDDNESSENELTGAPRTGGHGGYVHGFNHK